MDIEALQAELGEPSLSAMAKRLGVTPTYISDLKAGRRKVSVPFALAVERETKRRGLVEWVIDGRSKAAA